VEVARSVDSSHLTEGGVGSRYTAVQCTAAQSADCRDLVAGVMLMLCVRCMQCDFAACPRPAVTLCS